MTPPSFLQSAEWETFERALGRATKRVRGALVIRRDLPLGFHYWYCPRPAPLAVSFFAEAKKVTAQEGSVFLRIDPAEEIAAALGRDARAGGVVRPARAVQPRETIVLDLIDSTEDELIAAMREKTRYNIRLAERRGVRVKFHVPRSTFQGLEIFWRLLQETAKRDGFQTHQKEYYEKMLEIRSDAFSNELFFAEYGGEPIAAAIVNFHRPNRTATYLHGASAQREVIHMGILFFTATGVE